MPHIGKGFQKAGQGRKDLGDNMGMMVKTTGSTRRVLTFQDISGSPVGTVSFSRTGSKNNKKKKRVNYNYREISGMILRAKKSVSAGQVVVSARSRVALLRRKSGTGDYNERELAAAIIHAEKMVRVAKKKLKHLKEEERAARGQIASEQEELEEKCCDGMDLADMEDFQSESSELSEEELRKLIQEMERQMQELLEESGGLEELSDVFFGGDMRPEELELWKKKHRAEEMKDIVDADMKYLKAMFERICEEQQEMATSAILELGNAVTCAPMPVEIAIPVEGGSVDVTL